MLCAMISGTSVSNYLVTVVMLSERVCYVAGNFLRSVCRFSRHQRSSSRTSRATSSVALTPATTQKMFVFTYHFCVFTYRLCLLRLNLFLHCYSIRSICVEHTHTHTWPVCFKDIQDVSYMLISLHWLRSLQRIQFKVAVLTYKVLHGCAPSCLLRIPLIYLYCDCLSVWCPLYCDCLTVWCPGSAASVCVGVYETTWSCHRKTGACSAVGGRS